MPAAGAQSPVAGPRSPDADGRDAEGGPGPERILALFDFSNLAMRAFHGYGRLDMRSPTGGRTTLVHGLLSMTMKAIEALDATHVAFALDSRTPTFRRARVEQFIADHPDAGFPGYKSGNAETPREYLEQLPAAGRAIVAMGWRWYRADGFEADDLLATLAAQARGSFDRTWIVTNDNDLLGAVDDRTGVVAIGLGGTLRRLDEAGVKAKLGVRPDQVADWKALVGDASDNYPGCPGIGPSRAGPLIARFGSLDQLYANLHLVTPPGVRNRLAAGQRICRLSRELATLRLDAPVTLDPDAGPARPLDLARALAVCDELGLSSIARRLRTPAGAATP